MGKDTDIQWCDSTVNPTTGCDGCELWVPGKGGPCYAGNYHETRMAKALPVLYAPDFTDVRLAPGRMAKAAAWSDLAGKARPGKPWLDGRPRIIFVDDMGDLFSADVPFDYIKSEVVDVATSPKGRRHIWMLLTKRPARMAEFAAWLKAEHGVGWPANVWAGTSITRKANAGRVDHLKGVPAAVRFLSMEPLREAVDLSPWLTKLHMVGRITEAHGGTWLTRPNEESGIHLVIVGGESRQQGHEPWPFDVRWARDVIARCRDARVHCFVKQLGSRPYDSAARVSIDAPDSHAAEIDLKDSHGGDWTEWSRDLRVRQMPNVEVIAS